MPPITNWSRESRTPTLEYRNRETDARAVLYRTPDSYVHKWRAAILVDGYPVWSRGFETKDAKQFRDALRERPAPDLTCPECPNDAVIVGQKSADGPAAGGQAVVRLSRLWLRGALADRLRCRAIAGQRSRNSRSQRPASNPYCRFSLRLLRVGRCNRLDNPDVGIVVYRFHNRFTAGQRFLSPAVALVVDPHDFAGRADVA